MHGQNALPILAALLRPLAVILLLTQLPVGLQAQEEETPRWFEVERLNAGLPPAPAALDRETPRGVVESLLAVARHEDWARGAHLLDLSHLPPEWQESEGARLARQLALVVQRKLWLDLADLSDRPDAVLEEGSETNPMVGQARRSLELATMEVDGRPASLRLDRLKPPGGDPVWLFSDRTVRQVPALYRAFGPGWLERQLPPSWREQTILSLYRWELVAAPLALVLVVATLLLTRRLLGWLAKQLPWDWLRRGARSARTPLALVAAASLGQLLLSQAVSFSGPITNIVSPILFGLIVVGLAMAALRAVDAGLDIVTTRFVGEIDDSKSTEQRHFYTSVYALRRIIVLVAVVLVLGIVLSQFRVFETIGVSLLASAGVLTVVLGIAGQAILGNILSSLQIAIAKPIRIGDSVYYDGHWAYVESIFYTFVCLRSWDERRLIVPVKYFVSKPFENWTMRNAQMTRTFEIHLDHTADPEALRAVFEEIAREDPDVLPDQLLKMLVADHRPEGQVLQFYATAPDPTSAWNMHARLREAMLAWVRENHPEWWPRDRIASSDPEVRRASAAE